MNNAVDFQDDIFNEKSLYEVFRASKQIERSKFNTAVIRLTTCLSLMYVIANYWLGVENEYVISAIQRLSAAIITATTAILGFLIAGFSIFVSATPISIFRMLIMTRYENTNISYFKQIIFNFLNVFTVYLIAMAVALAVNTICPMGWVPFMIGKFSYHTVSTFNSSIVAALSMLTVYSILRLKSFIWTMYQGLLINIELSGYDNK